MFKKRKLKKELQALVNFIGNYGRDAIYETEIVRCWAMEDGTAYIKFDSKGKVDEIGTDYRDKFHYID
jgi:hypothetical protein